MRLAEILERIEQRLAALGLSADTASKLAGKPDAIRNIRRAMKGGTRQGVQTATLDALAPVLQTTAEWLLAGTDDEPASPTPSAAPRYGQGAGMLPMQLADLLMRIDSRLNAVGLSARAASLAAGKPDAIRNLQRGIRSGHRQGVSTATLTALAPILQTTVGWLMTGKEGDGEELAAEIAADEMLRVAEAVNALAWAFQALSSAPEAEARVLARAVMRAIRQHENQRGGTISEQDKRARVEMAIQLFRSE